MSPLRVTEVGRQVAFSGLLPSTAAYLLDYLVRQDARLHALVPDGEPRAGETSPLDYCLLNACLTAPEFSGSLRTRFLPLGFATDVSSELAERYAPHLAEPRWQAYRMAANAAALLMDWLEGLPLPSLEERFPEVRAGTFEGLRRDLVWMLWGLAHILAVATRPELSPGERPACMRALSQESMTGLCRLLPHVQRLAGRLASRRPARFTGEPETSGPGVQ